MAVDVTHKAIVPSGGRYILPYADYIAAAQHEFSAPLVRSATVVVAASNASTASKEGADIVCSGVADDVDVQTALDALEGTNTTGKIILTEGLFYFADSVSTTTKHHVVLEGRGKGTIINWTTGGNYTGKFMFDIGDVTHYMQRWTIQNMHLTCNGANVTGGGGIRWYASEGEITSVKIDSYNEYGLYVGQTSSRIMAHHNSFVASPLAAAPYGIFFAGGGTEFCWVTDNEITGDTPGNNEVGVLLQGIAGTAIRQIWIERNVFAANKRGIYGTDVTDITIRDNKFGDIINNRISTSNIIYLTNTALGLDMKGISITDNYFAEWGSANPATIFAISIIPESSGTPCTELMIKNNHFDGNSVPQRALNFNFADRYSNGQVSGNAFIGHTVEVTSIEPDGITIENNVGVLGPGEKRVARVVLTGALQDALDFAWQNPNDTAIMIDKVAIDATTPSTLAASMDIGFDADGTGAGVDFFDDVPIDVAGVYDSTIAADQGQQVAGVLKMVANGGASDWITGFIRDASGANLVGFAYIYYTGV